MNRFVVLLRGVNVGKGNRVPMAEFRALLEGLGCTSVRTLLNSGNAVLSSARRSTHALAGVIAEALQERLEVATPVIVKSAAELRSIVEDNPFPPAEPEQARFLVAFAMDTATLQELKSVAPLLQPHERFAVTDHAAYLHCAGGLLDSRASAAILGRAGRSVTTRNWATVIKLSALLAADAA